jgi:quercetin dioxygenase-like cupin family protein
MAGEKDAVTAAPHVYTVLFENDRIRALEIRMPVGARSPMHSHPDTFLYIVANTKVKFTDGDGNSIEAEFPAGAATWREAESHSVENVGTGEALAIAIEMKR